MKYAIKRCTQFGLREMDIDGKRLKPRSVTRRYFTFSAQSTKLFCTLTWIHGLKYRQPNCITWHFLSFTSISMAVNSFMHRTAIFCNSQIDICFLKLSAQRNETETKPFQNSFRTVSFQFHFVVRSVLRTLLPNSTPLPPPPPFLHIHNVVSVSAHWLLVCTLVRYGGGTSL